MFLSYSEHFSVDLYGRDRLCDRFVRVSHITRLDSVIKECLLRRRGAMAAHHLPTIYIGGRWGLRVRPPSTVLYTH